MPNSIEQIQAVVGDRYRIERKIGAGGMATVYLAEDLKRGRQVAVKVLDADVAASMSVERFLREIRLVASLQGCPH
jgi:serine/threonine-protein kinase